MSYHTKNHSFDVDYEESDFESDYLSEEDDDNHHEDDNEDNDHDYDYEETNRGNYSSSKRSKTINYSKMSGLKSRKPSNGGKWTIEEDNRLREIVESQNAKNWKKISTLLGTTRTDVQCLHRWNKVLKPGLHKGAWSREEDIIVRDMVLKHGIGKVKWSEIANKLPGRIGKQCRERWFNHLDPTISKKDWSESEDQILYEAQKQYGNRWCDISKMLPGRTENAVKNRWNSSAMKRWIQDRNTTSTKITSSSSSTHSYSNLNLSPAKSESELIDTSKSISVSSKVIFSSKINCEMLQFPSSNVNQEKMKIPDNLRPPKISTTQVIKPYMSGSEDQALLSLLQELKSSPLKNDGKRKHTQLLKSVAFDSDLDSEINESQEEDRSNNHIDNNNNNNDSDEDENDSLGDLTSRGSMKSPTSVALDRFRSELSNIPHQNVPKTKLQGQTLDWNLISLLPHFNYLNESIQRNIIRQLLSRFQSTSFTPRNFCFIKTPTNKSRDTTDVDLSSSSLDITGLVSPLGAITGINPNCFEMDDDPIDNHRHTIVDHNTVHSDQSESASSKSSPSTTLTSDELAIGAVVSVAMQIATGNVNPELLSFLGIEQDTIKTDTLFGRTRRHKKQRIQ